MTWSILVRDPATGALGAAVASRFFAVGAVCIHVEGGVARPCHPGAGQPDVRLQAMPDCARRPTRPSWWATAWCPDPGGAQRQFHILDAAGRVAQHTGDGCVDWAGHGCAAAGRVRRRQHAGRAGRGAGHPGRLPRRAGPMAERLLAAMQAGEAAGGDKRGRQSAALKLCTRDPYPDLDIRADDHPDPLTELRRLHRVSLERFAVFRRHLAGRDTPGAKRTAPSSRRRSPATDSRCEPPERSPHHAPPGPARLPRRHPRPARRARASPPPPR